MADALTQGLRSTGMMAVADPTFSSSASQAYAAAWVPLRLSEPPSMLTCRRSQRVLGESQLASQLNAQESQFMRATGNIVRFLPCGRPVPARTQLTPDTRRRPQQQHDAFLARVVTRRRGAADDPVPHGRAGRRQCSIRTTAASGANPRAENGWQQVCLRHVCDQGQ